MDAKEIRFDSCRIFKQPALAPSNGDKGEAPGGDPGEGVRG
jgi:hypothetical protein